MQFLIMVNESTCIFLSVHCNTMPELAQNPHKMRYFLYIRPVQMMLDEYFE
jgi:hypothetical protein